MNFYIFTMYLLFQTSVPSILSQFETPSDTWNPSLTQRDCQPGCSNSIPKECNRFEMQLRATITKCSKNVSPFASVTPKTIDDNTICQFKCVKKLHAVIKLTNQGETTTYNQYIIIDHVIDAGTGQRVSLLNPYIVVLKQKPLMQLYGLKYRNVVNGEATEQVINKREPGFTGCDDISDSPTCGNIRYNGDVVPYSQGFCCSCDDNKNFRRQPRSTEIKGNLTTGIQNLIYREFQWNDLLFSPEIAQYRKKKSVEPRDFNDYRTSIRLHGKVPIVFVTPKYVASDTFRNSDAFSNKFKQDIYDNSDEIRTQNERDVRPHNVQIRGGQNCDEPYSLNSKANPKTYQDSAHCLRFSKIWYAVYQLSDPVLEHSIFFKIFEKREKEDGSTLWVDFTGCKTITVGTLHNKFEDCSLLVHYDSGAQAGETIPYALDPNTKRVLIPQSVPRDDVSRHPESEGGPTEYLVVDNDKIKTSGEQCNTAGVGYSAFYNQPQRCQVQRGSCLKNQPSQMWRRDKKACRRNRRGLYFLKNYARVPDDALRKTKKSDSKYLALHFSAKYKSTIDIELRADDNIVFRNAPLAKIIEIYVDSTSETTTILTIKILNTGLISNVFRPRLSDCPVELPVDWGNLEGDPCLTPPQRHSTFTLRLLGILPVKNFYCTIEALSARNEIVAVRRIRVVKYDRCICSWHCLCACYKKTGLGCVLMSMEHYRAAGFIGSMPLSTNMVQVSYLENVLFGFLFFTVLLIIILLIMGLTKALIGLCFFVPVGIWGLDMLVGLHHLDRYYEDEFSERSVVYDDQGWPVNPDTHQRNVRIVESKVEFCLNVIFFFTYPMTLLCKMCGKVCCPFYSYTGNEEDKGEYFESVNTVSYTKCPEEKLSSGGSDFNDMFEFEDEDICAQ